MTSSKYAPRFVATIKHGFLDLNVLWPSYLTRGLLELNFSLCGHHTSKMPSSNYAPRFVTTIPQTWASSIYTPSCVAIIPQTWPPRVMLLALWPPFLKHGILEMLHVWGTMASKRGHNSRRPCLRYDTTNEGLSRIPCLWYHTSNMASSSYAPRVMAIIPQTWPHRVMLLVLWTPYLKHGLLELYSSFCGHHTSHMVSSNTLRFLAIIPQTRHPRVMLPILWPPFLKYGLLEIFSSFFAHHSSNMVSSIYTPSFVAIIPQTWPPRVILFVL